MGMCIYCFEGIGVVMPIMHTCENKQNFKKLFIYVVVLLTAIYIAFSCLCVFAWGTNMTEPIITEMLPADSIFFTCLKLFFACNLICSYPVFINPTNTTLEYYLFSCMKKSTPTRYWLKNLSRFMIGLSTIYCGIVLADKIDKFLSLVGALLCAPLALTIPSLIHIKLLARTKKVFQK